MHGRMEQCAVCVRKQCCCAVNLRQVYASMLSGGVDISPLSDRTDLPTILACDYAPRPIRGGPSSLLSGFVPHASELTARVHNMAMANAKLGRQPITKLDVVPAKTGTAAKKPSTGKQPMVRQQAPHLSSRLPT